jgi:HEAT repeat protein
MDPFAREPEQAKIEQTEEVTASEEEVRPVRELLQAILKTKRAFEMYPANNPILQKFREDLIRRFGQVLDEAESLPLMVRQYEIFYKGAQVYHNTEKEDNLALFFYKDGLRELTFTAGLTEDEILDFVDIIRDRPEASVESYDDDIVTLLWEKDFVHLSYYVVEEFAEGSSLEQAEEARLLGRGAASEGDLEGAYQDAIEEDTEGIFSPLETISLGFKGVFSLGEEEVKSLKEEMEGLTDENFLNGAIDVLFESLYIDKGTGGFELIMANLDSALNYLVENAVFGTAALILKRFRETAQNAESFSPQERTRIMRSVSAAGGMDMVKKISDCLAGANHGINTDSLRLFLSQLEKNAIIPLFSLASEVQDINARKVVLDSLVTLGRDSLDVLSSAVKDRRWQVARNAVAILGRIGDKAAVDILRQAINHSEPNVRREVIRSLGIIGGPKAGEVLLIALDDTDQQIRTAALRFLPRAQSLTVLDNLVEFMNRPDFPDKPFAERRAMFEVFSEIGQERVLEYMVKILKKKGFFSSTKKDELRACAAYGLGNIVSSDSLAALKKEKSRAKKGSVLYEAISYSISKLDRPASRQ